MHEIIRSYDRPVGDDPAYVYLICVGLFVGQTVEWNVRLHRIFAVTLTELLGFLSAYAWWVGRQ